jgi:isopentenyl phosphate kinase
VDQKTVILKIGGSAITDKNAELAAKTEIINRLAEEIKKANLDNLLIVHGGGSFGHPMAKKYAIKEGLKQEGQKTGFAETHHVMTVLNGLVMDALIWHNVLALSVTPSSCIIAKNGRIWLFEKTILRTLLKMGITPVLYGDTILDDQLGFTVISGDQIVSHLANEFGASRIVMGVDVDGLFDSDPKDTKNPKLYTQLNLEELESIKNNIGISMSSDVTGGMIGKVNELTSAIEKGIPVSIVNAKKRNRVYKALIGANVEGTILKKA